ncbi:alpha/beta fold hydrolase [Alcanivorax sp. JB21]|uniref:alpha/beta fold hydrolase n=1 Tax=Alcanivorax limicola TaxID=2874102 RepID=UPI001CBF05E2|nr:alpha/beta fold hydrolase [Alcanivorax limicola]MBZ2187961.1 alpha/beta fold hydrolase [Alcanivorax limicola]
MIRSLLLLVATTTTLLSGCGNLAQIAYDTGLRAETSRAQLAGHTLTLPARTDDAAVDWHYLATKGFHSNRDTDQRPVVLLVHGFGADSSNWLRMIIELKHDFLFVVPDLPGHGASSGDTDTDYRLEAQARRLLSLMSALDVEAFHVAGNSMGGAISLEMARLAPTRVRTLGLVNAAGLTLQTPEFLALISDGGNPLIPRDVADFRETLKWAMAEPPWLPDFFVRVMGEKKAANAARMDKVWADLGEDPAMARGEDDGAVLASINNPALVIWGDQDRLLSNENADRFIEYLPNSRKIMLPGIGHAPMVEAPRDTAMALGAFWLQQEGLAEESMAERQ